jgi:hypothetical protein
MPSSIGRVTVLADWLVDRRWASLDFRDVAADIRQRINDAIQVCVNDVCVCVCMCVCVCVCVCVCERLNT